MNMIVRAVLLLALVLCVWPELGRYRAEWRLAEADARLQRALRGLDRGALALQSVGIAATQAHGAAEQLPGDARPPLFEGIALILAGKGAAALAVLDAAIAAGERPELTINLGRARTLLGDARGADSAYLRTAWASPLAIATLPAEMRATLQGRVATLEGDLRAGRLSSVPGG